MGLTRKRISIEKFSLHNPSTKLGVRETSGGLEREINIRIWVYMYIVEIRRAESEVALFRTHRNAMQNPRYSRE